MSRPVTRSIVSGSAGGQRSSGGASARSDSAGAFAKYEEALAMYREVFEDEEHPKVKETAEKIEALRSAP